jgi:S1-C subfamily serine protease
MAELLQALNAELADLVATARRSVVQLHNGHGAGAGTILHAGGLVVTNAHVVRRQAPQVTLWDGRILPAQLLAFDEGVDLAALAVNASHLAVLPMADGRGIRPGEWVIALGHPWGVVGASSGGMVIDIGHPLEGLSYRGALLQVGMQLRPGHSGGPMLNSRGELVGINTMIAGPQVGLAIPVQTVKRFLKQALGSQRHEPPRGPRASAGPNTRLL